MIVNQNFLLLIDKKFDLCYNYLRDEQQMRKSNQLDFTHFLF